MNIHGGSPKSDGYKEEHAAGVIGCTTGNSYKYFEERRLFRLHRQRIDRCAHRQSLQEPRRPEGRAAGEPAYRRRRAFGCRSVSASATATFHSAIALAGDTRYGNAIEPIQDAGQVYDMLMRAAEWRRVRPPPTSRAATRARCHGRADAHAPSVVDFILEADIKDAKRRFGMDSEHARKLDGMLENCLSSRRSRRFEKAGEAAEGRRRRRGKTADSASAKPARWRCTRPTGNGANKLEPRPVVAGARPDDQPDQAGVRDGPDARRGVHAVGRIERADVAEPRHPQARTTQLEHNGDVDGLVKIDTYYSEKFAGLLTALKSVDDGGGRSLRSTTAPSFLGMECWSEFSSSGHYLTRHIPFVFAGQGGGRFKTGRIIDAKGRNNNDVLVACQNAAGIEAIRPRSASPSLCQGAIMLDA